MLEIQSVFACVVCNEFTVIESANRAKTKQNGRFLGSSGLALLVSTDTQTHRLMPNTNAADAQLSIVLFIQIFEQKSLVIHPSMNVPATQNNKRKTHSHIAHRNLIFSLCV